MQIYPTCTNFGFSTSAFSRGDKIWRKGTTKYSCSHLAVDISRCWASNCAGKPPVSMRGSIPRYRARKKGCCIGRKQESIFKSGAWTVDLHSLLSAKQKKLCLAGLYTGGSDGPTRDQAKASVFIFFLVLQSRTRMAEPHPWFQVANVSRGQSNCRVHVIKQSTEKRRSLATLTPFAIACCHYCFKLKEFTVFKVVIVLNQIHTL